MTIEKSIAAAAAAWEALTASLGFTIRAKDSVSNAGEMMSLLDRLLEIAAELGDKAPAGIQGLIDFATDWVTEYEFRNEQIQSSDPVELLKHLMDSNGLVQTDLAQEFGGQSVVSAVLRGARKINGRQAVALGNRFGISAVAFLEGANAEHPAITSAQVVPVMAPIPNVARVDQAFHKVRLVDTMHPYVITGQSGNFVGLEVRNYEGITTQQATVTIELQDLLKKQSVVPLKGRVWSRRKPSHA